MSARTILLIAAIPVLAAATDAPRHRTLTLDDANALVAAALAEARKAGTGGAVAVVDDGGHLLAFGRADGTFPAASQVSVGKARTSALFRIPTARLESAINVKDGAGRTAFAAVDGVTPLQGGLPVLLDGRVAGAIGVSGARSAQHDEELAVAAIGALPGASAPATPSAPTARVSFFPRRKVDAAFTRGAPLIEEGSYKVHASHRDRGNGYKAEVHERDTDVMYVLRGSATLVTGGKLSADAAPVAPGEIRAASIEGGESRSVGSGDVIVIPKGTPHWFREVPASFDYYVVKAVE